MIEFDIANRTYTCPYCQRIQTFSNTNSGKNECGIYRSSPNRSEDYRNAEFDAYTIVCSNRSCKKISVVCLFGQEKKQIDLLPQNVYKSFPDYVPEPIRNDYVEACSIINLSPKAAATLLRRCLQGMIHDFWDIHEKNLNAEITALKDRVTPTQWKAIDGIRKLGNIGAHMEHDVNIIIDIDAGEAEKMRKLIELLIDKWYIARHEEESLYSEVVDIAEEKEEQKAGE